MTVYAMCFREGSHIRPDENRGKAEGFRLSLGIGEYTEIKSKLILFKIETGNFTVRAIPCTDKSDVALVKILGYHKL